MRFHVRPLAIAAIQRTCDCAPVNARGQTKRPFTRRLASASVSAPCKCGLGMCLTLQIVSEWPLGNLVLLVPTPSKRLPRGIRGVIPASELERHSHTCITKFICNRAVDQRPSDNHSAYAQCRDRLSPGMTGPLLIDETALQDTDHPLEHGLERAFHILAATCDVARQCRHRA